ncbi:hypothetical protein G9F31_03590 [Acinetobacter sp. 187]|uniref:hypothetical protein n=1 Tax=Acinetobacter lanii TaxID=2715163 RepID=UPI00140988FD|nr:hypothetical protein [Acinetobacter lanii]NHC02856.1 hypothetical protein [Acinetobacter lanii]
MNSTLQRDAFLIDLCFHLKEKADDSSQGLFKDDYELGYSMAMYEVMSLVHQQAKVFDLPLKALGLDGVDPERDYLYSKRTTQSPWTVLEHNVAQRIPSIDEFQYDGSVLNIVLDFHADQKTVRCEAVLAFKMIEEGCAFHTLANQNLDGKTWLMKVEHTHFLSYFNQESESIYADSLSSYVLVTQGQIFEWITTAPIQIH